MGYYKQREWRISGKIRHKKGPVVIDPSEELKKLLIEIDKEFFTKMIQYNGFWSILDRTLVHNGFKFSNRDIFSYVNCIFCPPSREAAVKDILNKRGRNIEVKPIT